MLGLLFRVPPVPPGLGWGSLRPFELGSCQSCFELKFTNEIALTSSKCVMASAESQE